jgi:hypothetical protein
VSGQVSVFAGMMGSRQDAKLFALVCIARPLGLVAFIKSRHNREFTFALVRSFNL